LWDSPSVSGDQKLKLLDAITARIALSREVRNFVAVLISNRRIHAYNEIAKEAIHHIYERMGIADAEIVSARELSPDEKRNLEFGAAQATGKTLRVRYSVDQEIMGGAIVKVGSTVFDGSIRGQLERMKEQLAAG
jgi:F-type H+-transporting ATPase subunit delta